MTWDLVERCNHGVPTSSPSGELLAQERVLEEIRRSWAKSLVRSEAIADEVHERGTCQMGNLVLSRSTYRKPLQILTFAS